uniref:Tobamovirus multiplication protein 2B-like n=1 Tax=Nicotiana sylvestris TaxID=4096 RepID=A0A1U7XNK0_NICSY|nr:PREDICTED: tobamovirus multiplication protein 2B-like [Nicotiana sylvestris]
MVMNLHKQKSRLGTHEESRDGNVDVDRQNCVGSNNNSRDGSTKTMVADQITQSIQSTSNLLHLMLQSSFALVLLAIFPILFHKRVLFYK